MVEPNQGQQGQSGEGAKEVKIGRYKSVEEAERGIAEGDRKISELGSEKSRLAEENERLRRELESSRAKPAGGPGPSGDTDLNKKILDSFLDNPSGFLEEHDRALINTMVEISDRRTALTLTVDKFMSSPRNADIAANPKLFNLHLADTDPKLDITERLKVAGSSMREALQKAAKDQNAIREQEEADRARAGAPLGESGDGTPGGTPRKTEEAPSADAAAEAWLNARRAEQQAKVL